MGIRLAVIAGLLGLGSDARAIDISFGGNARSLSMGGAGIAIVDRSERSTQINPASLALLNRRVKVGFPTLSFRAHGIDLGKAFEHITGNPDRNDTTTLARDFGRRDSDFGAGFGWGWRFGHMDVYGTGNAIARIFPNAALQNWAKTANGNVSLLTGAEQADMLGAAIYALPALGVAERISPAGSPTRVEVGVRGKLMRAIYSHYIVSSNNIRFGTPATQAPELGSGTTLTKDGFGLDFGVLAHPRDHAGFSGAVVVTNLIEPNFVFNGTDRNGAPARYDLQPRSVSVGSAYEIGKAVFALDGVDLSRAYGDAQARFGGEYKTRRFAFRAGYASARGFTAGLGWGYFDFAFGNKVPLEVTQTLRF